MRRHKSKNPNLKSISFQDILKPDEGHPNHAPNSSGRRQPSFFLPCYYIIRIRFCLPSSVTHFLVVVTKSVFWLSESSSQPTAGRDDPPPHGTPSLPSSPLRGDRYPVKSTPRKTLFFISPTPKCRSLRYVASYLWLNGLLRIFRLYRQSSPLH